MARDITEMIEDIKDIDRVERRVGQFNADTESGRAQIIGTYRDNYELCETEKELREYQALESKYIMHGLAGLSAELN